MINRDAWLDQAAAIVVALTNTDPVTEAGFGRWCVLCGGYSRTEFGAVVHTPDCVWRTARRLMRTETSP